MHCVASHLTVSVKRGCIAIFWLAVLCFGYMGKGAIVSYISTSKRALKIVMPVSMPFDALQAFGDAVFDKAPLVALTNYDVTIFLKRSQDVKDKRLWASEPIWFDDTSPPPQVFWLYGLQTAHQLQGWKERLPRADVPASRKRKLIAEEQAKGASSASRHVRPRKATVSSPRQACHPLHKGHGMELWPSAALHLADDLIDLGLEETVLLSELEFGGLINIGSYANTFKVSPCDLHRIMPCAGGFRLANTHNP